MPDGISVLDHAIDMVFRQPRLTEERRDGDAAFAQFRDRLLRREAGRGQENVRISIVSHAAANTKLLAGFSNVMADEIKRPVAKAG